jgi:hypothetical protein
MVLPLIRTWTVLCCLLSPATAPSTQPEGTEHVHVHLADTTGPTKYVASGFLHGFSKDGLLPPDALVRPLKVQLHRTGPGSTWNQAARMKDLGIRQQVVVSDGWGYGRVHPGDGGDWTRWEQFVADMVREARRRGLDPQWDIWNEPDHPFFWKRSPEQFDETWRRGYAAIRSVDADAVIVGPSWSNVYPGQDRFDEFVRFCQQHNVVPDYLCWHFPKDAVKEARTCRALLNRHGIKVKGLMVNEYALQRDQYAGRTAWLIAQLERTGIDAACHAVWGDESKGNLDGIIADPKNDAPKGQWWVYRRYAEATGQLVRTQPGRRIDLVAARDDRRNRVNILLGNAGGFRGDVHLHVDGFGAGEFLKSSGRVRVVVERIPENDGQAVHESSVVWEQTVVVRADMLEITLPWEHERDAYAVRISAAP